MSDIADIEIDVDAHLWLKYYGSLLQFPSGSHQCSTYRIIVYYVSHMMVWHASSYSLLMVVFPSDMLTS